MFAQTRNNADHIQTSPPASLPTAGSSAPSWLKPGARALSSASGSGRGPAPASDLAAFRHGRRKARAQRQFALT
jgi:hypothetical protein